VIQTTRMKTKDAAHWLFRDVRSCLWYSYLRITAVVMLTFTLYVKLSVAIFKEIKV